MWLHKKLGRNLICNQSMILLSSWFQTKIWWLFVVWLMFDCCLPSLLLHWAFHRSLRLYNKTCFPAPPAPQTLQGSRSLFPVFALRQAWIPSFTRSTTPVRADESGGLVNVQVLFGIRVGTIGTSYDWHLRSHQWTNKIEWRPPYTSSTYNTTYVPV